MKLKTIISLSLCALLNNVGAMQVAKLDSLTATSGIENFLSPSQLESMASATLEPKVLDYMYSLTIDNNLAAHSGKIWQISSSNRFSSNEAHHVRILLESRSGKSENIFIDVNSPEFTHIELPELSDYQKLTLISHHPVNVTDNGKYFESAESLKVQAPKSTPRAIPSEGRFNMCQDTLVVGMTITNHEGVSVRTVDIRSFYYFEGLGYYDTSKHDIYYLGSLFHKGSWTQSFHSGHCNVNWLHASNSPVTGAHVNWGLMDWVMYNGSVGNARAFHTDGTQSTFTYEFD